MTLLATPSQFLVTVFHWSVRITPTAFRCGRIMTDWSDHDTRSFPCPICHSRALPEDPFAVLSSCHGGVVVLGQGRRSLPPNGLALSLILDLRRLAHSTPTSDCCVFFPPSVGIKACHCVSEACYSLSFLSTTALTSSYSFINHYNTYTSNTFTLLF